MIQLDDVCFAYDDRPILSHLTETIEPGQAVLLSGPNGSGKSTLLRLLNGLIFPQQGTYSFDGTIITAGKMRDHAYSKWFHQRVGYVWQNPDSQLFCSSVREELAFGPVQMGLKPADIRQRVDDALELLGLTRLASRPPYTLSGGEKKRTAIASILTMNPQVWTMDEPESYLDADGLAWLEDFLPSLKAAGKTLIIAEALADGKSMNYAMDAAAGEWQLTDYVRKGIELLDNKKGFFLMTESGKIDWACHANDAAASIHDVLEMSNAVQTAVDFYNAHPNDTLILVTADHETGGMAIGYKTTNYDTFLTNLTHQKMSYAKFDSTYVKGCITNKTPFEAAMADVKANFGLTLPTDPDAASAGKLLLTDYEVENLRKAYERTLEVGAASQKEMSQQDYELYGTYIPFSMAICHTINHKSGMDHTTYAHTGAMVNIYALGVGAEKFRGVFDNTEIYHKLAELTGVQ